MVRRLQGRRPGGGHRGYLSRTLLIITLTLLTLAITACGSAPQSTLIRKGEAADRIWDVYGLIWIGAAIVFVLVEGLLVYTIIRFRRAPRTAHGRPVPVHGNTKLEIIWTIIPAVVLVFIAIPTLQIIADLAEPPTDQGAPLKVDVIGHQFYFEFSYPELGVKTTNAMHIPTGTIVDISLQSNDVIHSFWVPQLAGKTDLIPGRTNRMWLEAAEAGTYHGQCAEFCGLGHALMRFTVEAQTQADFDAWVNEQKNPTAGGGGQQLAQSLGCTGCHSVDGTASVGPTWKGLYDHSVKLSDGSSVTADDAYIKESILQPNAQVVGGFQPIMPSFEGRVTDADIQELIAYIKSLGQ
ncbi:MAG TPA: cytochrome c oxidase subunit II [Thermomicrobiales bacterium]|jgi:cytochrome c oxidase subunit 2|nr:cytochrome c oxidase subunit II [Chloroflexota bacterium]HQX63488.1 cytochrome c oxidase subunit II [Thermomicrobiales bacterium]HBY45884.1 cytochrome c oxidase subunit II [Chloroflexota bacterium]HCG30819.1 cytochrome c oxidase subunit II [Chloroflexota bacterium]HQZ89419.1 cytochrome c oxidase subunit II [Thermomicrobiales bacterium]